ncbi:MAG: peptidylprolyl isomerase [Acidaminobacteraceae bacterium]
MENKILAVVDGREVTQTDMEILISHLGQQAMQFANPEGEKRLLEELINEELFYSNAVELNIEENQAFKAELEKSKVTLMKQFMIKKTVSDVRVTEDEITEYYLANSDQFVSQPSLKASHILVETEELAKEIASEIAGGSTFEEAATKHSTCPSKERGGDLGFFSRGQMVPEFEEVAFALDLGVVSEPVKTQFGFHLIKATETKEAGISTLEEVRMSLLQTLTAKKQSETYLSKVEELKGKYSVEVK